MGLVDCDALADVLIEVHNNPVEARKRGEKARKFVVENLDWDIIAKQFHDLIESRVGMPHPMQTFIETRGDVDDEL